MLVSAQWAWDSGMVARLPTIDANCFIPAFKPSKLGCKYRILVGRHSLHHILALAIASHYTYALCYKTCRNKVLDNLASLDQSQVVTKST